MYIINSRSFIYLCAQTSNLLPTKCYNTVSVNEGFPRNVSLFNYPESVGGVVKINYIPNYLYDNLRIRLDRILLKLIL